MKNTKIIMLGSLSKGKSKEYNELFKKYPEISFKTLKEMAWNPSSFEEVENGKTYYENAFSKCQLSHQVAKVPTIADDSGIEVEALDGKPGVHSHRFATANADESQDSANNRKLLESLKGNANRNAKFVCTIVFMIEGVVLSAQGELQGTILESPRGNMGFGYDPLFVPKGSNKTLAEMTLEEKNRISHRAQALDLIMSQIKGKNIQLVCP